MTRHDEIVTIGKASLDQVIAERDQAVARMQAAEDAMRQAQACESKLVSQLNVLIEKLRADNTQLREDNQRLGTIAAQFAGAKDVTKLAVIDRDRLVRLEALEEYARVTIGDLVGLVDEPGYQTIPYDDGYYRDGEE